MEDIDDSSNLIQKFLLNKWVLPSCLICVSFFTRWSNDEILKKKLIQLYKMSHDTFRHYFHGIVHNYKQQIYCLDFPDFTSNSQWIFQELYWTASVELQNNFKHDSFFFEIRFHKLQLLVITSWAWGFFVDNVLYQMSNENDRI